MTGPWERRVQWYVRARWLGGAVVGLGIALAYVGWCRPASARARAAEAELGRARGELAAVEGKLAGLPELRSDVSRLATRVESFGGQMPATLDAAGVVKDVQAAGRQASVRKLTCEAQPAGQTAGGVTELPVAIAFEGDFFSAFNFIRRLEEVRQASRVRSLRIRGKAGEPGQVDVRVSVTAYAAVEGE